MCGIIGYLGPQNPVEVIFEGLKKLEYRGYDSAGIALIQDKHFEVRRSQGKLSELGRLLNKKSCYRSDRDRPYPLGHPWPPLGNQCPSSRGRTDRPGP